MIPDPHPEASSEIPDQPTQPPRTSEASDPPSTEHGDLTQGSISRHIFTFGLPLVLAMVFHALFNLVDIFIVGRIEGSGSQAMAALHVASIINMTLMVVVNGISVSSIAIISRYFGERRFEDANEVSRQSLLLMLVLSVISCMIGLLFSGPLVALILGVDHGEVYDMAYIYLLILFIGAFTMFFLLQITQVLRAAGHSVWPMILLIGANVLNIVLDVFWVFGIWFFPEWGVEGAAWATVVARGIGMVVGFLILIKGNQRIRLSLQGIHVDFQTWWRLLKIGLPSTAQLTVRILSMWFLTRLIFEYDRAQGILGAAFAVGIRLDMLALFGSAGWGAAASSLVGQNLGADRADRSALSGWLTTAYGAFMMLVVGALFITFAPAIVRIFDSNPAIIDHGVTYIQHISFSYIFVAVSVVLASSLNGAGSTKMPLLFDFIGYGLLQVVLALLLKDAVFNGSALDHIGIYYSMVIVHVFVAIVYVVWFKMGKWKTIKIE